MKPSPAQHVVNRAAEFVAVRGVFRTSGRQLLVALVLLFVSFPFLDSQSWGDAAFNWLFTLVMFTSLLAVGGRGRVLAGGIMLLAPTLFLRWLPHLVFLRTEHPASLAAYCVFVGYVIIQLLRYVLRTPKVDAEVLASGISIYLLLGWLWAFLFLLCAKLQPGAFSLPGHAEPGMFDMFYFSFTTLTTAGYGDILPLTRQARMLATMESVFGVLYIAVLVARLVALYTHEENRR